MPWENEKIVRASLNRFLAVFLAVGALLAGLAGLFLRDDENQYIESIRDQERYVIGLQQQIIHSVFEMVAGDLVFLANQNEVVHFIEQDTPETRAAMAAEFFVLADRKKVYDQIRFLDESGMEVVRVNYEKGRTVVVSNDELQDKGTRYYFRDTFALDRGDIFVSPLDLNIEQGRIERPFKPMIRLGTPVFDGQGRKRGVVLVNYLAQNMLGDIFDVGLASLGSVMLLNPDGYWLLSETTEEQWGFMIKERADLSFAVRYPDEWAMMLEQERGQFVTRGGLLTFAAVKPLERGEHSSTGSPLPHAPSGKEIQGGEYFWILASLIPVEAVEHYSGNRKSAFFLVSAGVFVAAALAAWMAALLVTRRRIYHAQLESLAHYDGLTGLPNRILFYDRLRLAHGSAQRYQRRYAVLRLDLEGPEPDKEGRGSAVSEDAIVRVGEVLRHAMRRSDTVARLGGNSFAIILVEVAGIDAARLLGERVIAILRSPHCLGADEGCVTASAGIAVYPDHSEDLEEVVLLADQAVALAKARGGNCSVPVSG